MARFGFSIPGRKKAPPPPITVTEPMTKAHKILGSVPLNIDSARSWDESSIPDAEVTGSSESKSYTDSASRQPTLGSSTPASSAEPWGDESDIIPPTFKLNGGIDDAFTETSTIIRSKQSSSTLKSWYDKSKMPLAVSQQTSASAMAKGLPSKAHKMLDMDNLHTMPKSKKPAKLDFSTFLSGGWSPKQNHNEPILGSEYLTTSPSLLSPPLSASSRRRRILQKRPTKESLREAADLARPPTSGSSVHKGKEGHLKGLPDLYEHYEQMSFRQILDCDLEQDDEQADGLGISPISEQSETSPHTIQTDIQLEKMLQQAHITALAASKSEAQSISPEDGASVSSRHTRTSRASIITRSIQDSDLQETSVLMLSSDSEDDSYDEPETRSQTSTSTRPISRIPETMAILEQGFAPSPRSLSSTDKRASKSSKRTSFAPSVTYLGVPNGQSSNATSHDSQMTIPAGINASTSSARGSIISSSSASSAPTWQTRSDHDESDAYVVAMVPTKSGSPEESDGEKDDSRIDVARESMTAHTDQPTPPLSPTSVDFYIRSAHSSIDGPGGHNRFMAVTRQEEMLLSALRHKRQTMRESKVSNQPFSEERKASQKHRSKASDATVTNLLDFDFPVPPSSNDSTPQPNRATFDTQRVRQTSGTDIRSDSPSDYGDDADSIISPAPIHPRQSQMILKNSRYQPPEPEPKPLEDERYNAPHQEINPEDLDDLLRGIGKANSRSPPQRTRSSRRSSSSSSSSWNSRPERRVPKLTLTSNMDPVMESDDHMEAAGIPRPDSPISPSVFPLPPTMAPLNKRMARLSAVGGVRMGDAPDWFKMDEQ